MKHTFLTTCCALVTLGVTAHAQDRTLYWNGSTDGNWSTVGNWDELSTDDTTLVSATSAPVSGDIVVLTGFGVTTTNQDIAGLVLDGLWFGPSNDTLVVNGLTLGLNSGGQSVVDGVDLVGTTAGRIDTTSGLTTVTLVESPLEANGSTPNIEQFLLALDPGTVLVNGDGNTTFLDGLEVASVDPANGTFTLNVAPSTTRSDNLVTFPANWDLNVALELHGSNDSEVFFHVARSEGTTDFDFLITANAAGDVVGLRMEGGDDIPASLGFNNAVVTLSNDNNDFLGAVESAPTNGGIEFTSVAPIGSPSAVGAGALIFGTGGGGNLLRYTGGSTSTDRTLQLGGGDSGFQVTGADATIDWTGTLTTGSGGGTTGITISSGTTIFNLFGAFEGTGTRLFEVGGSGTFNVLSSGNTREGPFVVDGSAATAGYVDLSAPGAPSSFGLLDSFDIPNLGGGRYSYIGSVDVSTDIPINLGTDNVRPTFANDSPNGSTLTINGDVDNPHNTFDFREVGFDAASGDIILNATRVSRGDGNAGYLYESSESNTVYVNAPGSGSGRIDVDGNVVVPASNVPLANVTVEVAATITGAPAFSNSALGVDVQITVDDTTGLMPGMLAIHPNLFNGDSDPTGSGGVENRVAIFSVDSATELTLSSTPTADIVAGEEILFIGYGPLGYDRIEMNTGPSELNFNTTLINSSIDDTLIALNVSPGAGSAGETVSGTGALVPFLEGQIVTFSAGSILAPGNSIGTISFGSGAQPLSSFTMANGNTLDLEISGDQVDSVNVWATDNFEFVNNQIVLTNIGTSSPATGDFTVIENFSGTEALGSPIGVQLVGNFTNRTVTLTDNGDEFGLGITAFILSIEFTEDATTAFDDFVAAIPGITDTDPDSDEDNDGSSLAAEFIANTDPTDSSDAPVISFEFVMVGSDEFPAIRFTRPTDQVLAPTVGEVDDDLSTGPDFAGPPSTVHESSGTPFTGTGGVEYEEVLFRSNVTTAADEDQYLRVNGELILPE
ncbi:MAG: beta strand repeat-containing protein [Opitutales bacterium]